MAVSLGVGGFGFGAPAYAQEAEEPAVPEEVATEETIAATTAPTTVPPSTTTTKPKAPCDKPAGLAVAFEGRVSAVEDRTVIFDVIQVKAGTFGDPSAKVQFSRRLPILQRAAGVLRVGGLRH